MSAVLEARGLTVGYGRVTVVRDLDLTVEPGEVVALLGRNGAGKTTTLLALAGFLSPGAGEVRLGGEPAPRAAQARARRGLALMSDDRAVFPSLTVAQNLRLGRGPAEAALRLFPELEPLLSKRTALLSGGQQQMLGLALVLAAEPAAILIDELSLGLAPVVVERLLAAVRAATERGAGVLLVDQQPAAALELARRACVLVNGRLELERTAAEFAADPGALERAYLGSD
jgi:branched-chain amino acid transport system ATP-binding protein